MAFPKKDAFPPTEQVFSARCFAMGHPARLMILGLLCQREHYVYELVGKLPLGQSAVSSHLEILRRTGMISVVIEGRYNLYAINESVISGFGLRFESFVGMLLRGGELGGQDDAGKSRV